MGSDDNSDRGAAESNGLTAWWTDSARYVGGTPGITVVIGPEVLPGLTAVRCVKDPGAGDKAMLSVKEVDCRQTIENVVDIFP